MILHTNAKYKLVFKIRLPFLYVKETLYFSRLAVIISIIL